MDRLSELVRAIADDPKLRREFATSPKKFLEKHGVDSTHYAVPDSIDLVELENRLASMSNKKSDRESRKGESGTEGGAVPVAPDGDTIVTSESVAVGVPETGLSSVSERLAGDPDAPLGPFPTPESASGGDWISGVQRKGLPLPELAAEATLSQMESVMESAPQPNLTAHYPDAYFASVGTAISRALSRQPQTSGRLVQELVFGGDDRVRLYNVNAYPYRWLCSLIITAGNGTTWMGTGWLVSSRVVITAGHCTYLHNQGGWVRRVAVFPQRNGTQTQYSFVSVQPRSVEGWVINKAPEHDYGALILEPGNAGHGIGYIGFGVFDDQDLYRMLANITGYPSDKEPGTLWGHTRTLKSIKPRTLIYDIDTYGGMSGAPVIRWDGMDYIVVGIHNYGDLAGNQATRITPEVFQNIRFWISAAL